MGRNLGPLNIKDTYEGLVQISGSDILTDGVGNTIDNLLITASHALVADASISASYAQTSVSSSYATTATSSSYALTASFAENTTTPTLEEVLTAGNVGGAGQTIILSGSGVETRTFSTDAITSGIAGTDFLIQGGSVNAGLLLTGNGDTTNYIKLNGANGIQMSGSVISKDNITAPTFIGDLQGNADTATSASHSDISDFAFSATSASFATTSLLATSASHAVSSDTAISASHAVSSDTSISSSYSTFSETSVSSSHAISSDSSLTAVSASYALTASYVEGGAGGGGNLQETLTLGNSASIDINLSASMNVTPSADTNNSYYAKGGTLRLDSDSYNSQVVINVGQGNSGLNPGSGNLAFAYGYGNANNSANMGWIHGESNTINAPSYDSVIMGAFGSTIGASFSGIFAGQNNTISGGNNNVAIGGNSNQISGNQNYTFGGAGNILGNTTYGAIISGVQNRFYGGNDQNYVMVGGSYNTISANGGNGPIIIGGTEQTIRNFYGVTNDIANGFPREIYGAMLGGRNNKIGRTGTGANNSGANGLPILIGGYANQIGATTLEGVSFTKYSTILNSSGSQVDSGSFQGVIGGYQNYVSGSDNSYIIASNNSTIVGHNNSTIIGGSGLKTKKSNQVVVPELLVSGSTAPFINSTGSGTPINGDAVVAIASGNPIINAQAKASGIFAATNSTIGNGYQSFILGGDNHSVDAIRQGVVGGYDNDITAVNGGYIFGGAFGTLSGNAVYPVLVGGQNNAISTGEWSAVIAGTNNTNGHDNSVVLGGIGLTTTKDSEVVVPNLTISGSVTAGVYTLADAAGTTTMDCSLGNFFTYNAVATDTLLTATNIQAGQTISVKFTQNATPSLFTFDTMFEFEGGTPFTVSTGAGEVDVITFISFDGTTLQATGLKNFS